MKSLSIDPGRTVMGKPETIVEEIRSEFEAKSAVRDTALQRSHTQVRYWADAIRAAHRGADGGD